MSPPTFTQVSLPLTFTKPGPYAAQALSPLRLAGSGLSGVAGIKLLDGFCGASGSEAATTVETGNASLRKRAGCFASRLLSQPARAGHSVFERSMPSDLIRGWNPVRVKKTRQNKNQSPVLMQSEPIRL